MTSTTTLPWRKISSRSRARRRAVLEIQLARELLVAVEILDACPAALISSAMNGLPPFVLPSSRHADAVGSGRRELHVLDDLVPANQLVVRADLEPDKLFRRLQRPRRPSRRRSRRARTRRREARRPARNGESGRRGTRGAGITMSKDRPALRSETTMRRHRAAGDADGRRPGADHCRRRRLIRAGAGHDLARAGGRALRTAARGARGGAGGAGRARDPRVQRRRRPAGARRARSPEAGRRERHRRHAAAAGSW